MSIKVVLLGLLSPAGLIFPKGFGGTAQAQTLPGQLENGLFPLKPVIWEQNEIPVCWESVREDQFMPERSWVIDAIKSTWERNSVVRFTGWSNCLSVDRGVRIQIADAHPHTNGLGNQLDGRSNGMVLNFNFSTWGTTCQSKREYCIKTIAVHEFGHALGFSHENNRPDTPRDVCTEEPQGTIGDFMVTAWDLHSVMNYCNPKWSGDGLLSALDIEGLQLMYGGNRPLKSYHSGCTSVHDSRSPACMAAMHRYCYLNGKGSAAYPQEVGSDEFGLLCATATWYGNVAYSDIPNCAGPASNTQSAACYSSAHRYCDAVGHGGAGIIQELGEGVAGLACVPTPWYHIVKITELAKLHDGCASPAAAQNPACLSAAHRYCSSNGLGPGGVITELGPDEVALGCVRDAVYTAAKV